MSQAVRAKSRLLFSNQTFLCLVPLLVFNGLDQGFVYAVYNKVNTVLLMPTVITSANKAEVM